ncbi:hypothetical protein UNSWDHB_476 [Dehalobacter sp. UNSWDHB]|uniref:CpsD/CapB family tyrosine-protein kinase n=1 Tax=Dehalobacter sp. UNSWDHB TaxID=1339256 RepID=UPI0003878DA8|nr:polysaccharide biosynthesis tyrosine autokinase [Dehalobacter sp. UNSWDHB]EQB22194.1 hypothetical protein UNSWDHB_476 [Dehalobacter sp. UNSWDHB]
MQLKTFNVYDNQNKAVQDAFDMLTAKIHINNSQKKLKTFALTSCRPGEGKTSLAISLAISIAHSGWRVLLVDGDMRKPTASKRLSKETQMGLADYLAGKIEFSEAVSETNITNLFYFACGTDCLNPVELLCSARFQELINKARSRYDFVLFDTPALEIVADANIIASNVEATLIVVEAGSTSLVNIKRVKEQLENLNANILGVVLNKVKKHEYKRYFSSYNYFHKKNGFFKNLLKKKKTYSRVENVAAKENAAKL